MVPVEWVIACIVPLYKGKVDVHKCVTHKGISLLGVVGKVYCRILIYRIKGINQGMWLQMYRVGLGEIEVV